MTVRFRCWSFLSARFVTNVRGPSRVTLLTSQWRFRWPFQRLQRHVLPVTSPVCQGVEKLRSDCCWKTIWISLEKLWFFFSFQNLVLKPHEIPWYPIKSPLSPIKSHICRKRMVSTKFEPLRRRKCMEMRQITIHMGTRNTLKREFRSFFCTVSQKTIPQLIFWGLIPATWYDGMTGTRTPCSMRFCTWEIYDVLCLYCQNGAIFKSWFCWFWMSPHKPKMAP